MRLIDADKLEPTEIYVGNNEFAMVVYMDDINEMPTIEAVPTAFHDKCQQIEIQKRLKLEEELKEAEPIRHGKWVVEPDATVMHCDVCGWAYEYYGGLEEEWNHCPHCGAKMDEVTE